MNDGRAKMLLGAVAEAADALHRVVAVEAPEFAPFWSAVAGECGALVAASWLAPQELIDLADRIRCAFGVGMGSLTDLVLWREDADERRRANGELKMLRCRVADLAMKLGEEAASGQVNMLLVRRYLTAIEGILLDERQPEAAQLCRRLLAKDELSCLAVLELLDDLMARKWWHGITSRLSLPADALRKEIGSYLWRVA